jgi:hypothetical protein
VFFVELFRLLARERVRYLAAIRPLRLKPANPLVTMDQFCDAPAPAGWIRDRHQLAFQLRPEEGHGPSLDVLVKPGVPFEDAYSRRVLFKVEDFEVSAISVPDLIALKSGTGRQIDRSDIATLHRLEMLRSRRRDG